MSHLLLTFGQCSLCVRHCANHFLEIKSLNPIKQHNTGKELHLVPGIRKVLTVAPVIYLRFCTGKPAQVWASSWAVCFMGTECHDLAHVSFNVSLCCIHLSLKAEHRSHLLTVLRFPGGDRQVNQQLQWSSRVPQLG